MTRLIRIGVVPLLFLGCAFAQSNTNRTPGKKIYFLKDNLHRQWCGYASESRFKSQVRSLRAMVVGGVDYGNGHVSTVTVTETDETGDWAVNDVYRCDENGRIRSLKRTINIIPDDTSEEQLFSIENGRAVKQRSTYRELSTGKPTQKSADWFKPPPVVTNLQAFPFSALIGSKHLKIWSKGKVCVAASRP